MTAAVSTPQPPPDPPQVEHARQVALLTKHVEYFRAAGDKVRAADFARQLKGNADRIPYDEAAAALVAQFGFTSEVKPVGITANDAISYVAKVLHEVANGETRSHYQRAHRSVTQADAALLARNAKALAADPKAPQEAPHIDAAKMASPFDPAADVVEHLGLTDPAHVAAVRAL